MSHAVIIKNAVKKYGDFTALNGVSLDIKQGSSQAVFASSTKDSCQRKHITNFPVLKLFYLSGKKSRNMRWRSVNWRFL